MAGNALRADVETQLRALLGGGAAHVTLQQAADGMPLAVQARVPPNLPYSPWQVLEHMRRAQRDILNFSSNASGTYRPMQWPDDYWPREAAPPDDGAWQRCLDAIAADREAFLRLLADGDLTTPFPWGEGQNLLREALLIADHESYHSGELMVLRRLLGAWQPQEGHA